MLWRDRGKMENGERNSDNRVRKLEKRQGSGYSIVPTTRKKGKGFGFYRLYVKNRGNAVVSITAK